MEKVTERIRGGKPYAGIPPAFAALAALAVVWSAEAVVIDGVTYDETTGYVLMRISDNGYFSSVTGAVNWTTQKVPEPGTNYFVQSGKTLRTPKNDNNDYRSVVTFAGDSLTLGGGQITHCLNSGIGEDKAPGVQWYDLRILGGRYAAGCQLNVIRDSQITFVPTSLGPVEFDFTQTATGSAGTGLWFRSTTFSGTSAEATAIFYNSRRTSRTGIIFRGCDFSGFTGTFQFGKQGIDTSTYADFGNGTVFPGTAVIATNAEFSATTSSGSLSLDTIRIEPGGQFWFPKTDVTLNVGTLQNEDGRMASQSGSEPGIVNVTNNLVTDRTFVLSGFGYDLSTGTVQTVAMPFMTVPEGTSIPDGLFKYKPVTGGLPNIVVTSETVDGKIRLSVAKKEIETIKVRDSSAAESGGSSFQTKKTSNWSDGQQPHPGVDYMLGYSGYGNQLMTGDTTGAASAAVGACLFAGDSLTVLGGTLALCDVLRNVFSNLTVVAGATISAYTAWEKPNYLCGNTLTLLPSTSSAAVLLSSQNGAWIVVEHELLGDADLDVCRHSIQTGSGLIDLRALNTNYTGRITLACGGWRTTGVNWEGTNMVKQVTLRVRDARNLGGLLASFTYDALRVRDCQILSVTNDVAFTEQTRGLFIDGCARFNISSGKTLTLAQPLTFAGKLRKEGAGTLALGGTVAFTADRLSDPDGLDGTNVLEVVEGSVKPLSKTAADGLAMTFAAGTSLALDIDPADADMRQYGLYDIRESTPVTLASGVASLPVTLDGSGIEEPEPFYELGLVTVKSSTIAEALKGQMAVASPWKNYIVDLGLRSNPDTSCTIVATVRQCGMTIIFR